MSFAYIFNFDYICSVLAFGFVTGLFIGAFHFAYKLQVLFDMKRRGDFL